MLDERWSVNWYRLISKTLRPPLRVEGRPVRGYYRYRNYSVTLLKHLAVASYWIPTVSNANHRFRPEVEIRRKDPDPGSKVAHLIPSDIKKALLKRSVLSHWSEGLLSCSEAL